jgi:hypothetical protein
MSVFDFLKGNSFIPFPAGHVQAFAKQLLESVACTFPIYRTDDSFAFFKSRPYRFETREYITRQ